MPSRRCRNAVDTTTASCRRGLNHPSLPPPSTVITLTYLFLLAGSIAEVAMGASTSSSDALVGASGNGGGGGAVRGGGGIGLTPSDYFKIQSSECEDELRMGATVGTGTGGGTGAGLASTWQWQGETDGVWREIGGGDGDGEGGGNGRQGWRTFVVCDSSQGSSGYERKREVRSILGDSRGGESESSADDLAISSADLGYAMSEFPLYNGDDMTCLLLRCDAVRARTLREAAEASLSREGVTPGEGPVAPRKIKVQPLLPMMKVRKGTASACSRAARAAATDYGGGERRIQIATTSGPGLLAGDGVEGLAREVLGRTGTSGGGNLRVQLERAFPHTSTVLLARCEGGAEVDETTRRRIDLADDMDEDGATVQGAGDGVDRYVSDAFDAVSSRASVRASDGRGGGGGDAVYVEIDVSPSSSSETGGGGGGGTVTELGLLSLVAALAARDEVVSVEVVPTMRPW